MSLTINLSSDSEPDIEPAIEPDSEPDSEEEEWPHFKSRVLNRILEVHSAGSFATFDSFESFTPPGINIEGVGAIQFPLSQQVAEYIVQRSRQAPFGHGSQTLVDETVRKTWKSTGVKYPFPTRHGKIG